jgi:hypothetical protein
MLTNTPTAKPYWQADVLCALCGSALDLIWFSEFPAGIDWEYVMLRSLVQRFQDAKRRETLAYKLATIAVPGPVRRKIFEYYFNHSIQQNAGVRSVFESIHAKNWWRSGESKSGYGSELERTESLRSNLEQWLSVHREEVSILLDAPCGDFNWMRAVNLPNSTHYVGGDIVRSLIESNGASFANEKRSFIDIDIISDPLPIADAWLCRDVLFHFPFKEGREVIERFAASECRYFMSTTHEDARNDKDIKFGWFRPVNLSIAPYNLGPPVERWKDAPEGESDRYLGVWRNPRFQN